MNTQKPLTILMAEDDLEDCELVREAWKESKVRNPLSIVHDGEELMAYLRNEGKFADTTAFPPPALVLLDLNMPKMDGREALRQIKSDPHLRKIPIVILTTSQTEEDILRTYDLGVNSFVTKPVFFEGLVKVISAMKMYWFEIVKLPTQTGDV